MPSAPTRAPISSPLTGITTPAPRSRLAPALLIEFIQSICPASRLLSDLMVGSLYTPASSRSSSAQPFAIASLTASVNASVSMSLPSVSASTSYRLVSALSFGCAFENAVILSGLSILSADIASLSFSSSASADSLIPGSMPSTISALIHRSLSCALIASCVDEKLFTTSAPSSLRTSSPLLPFSNIESYTISDCSLASAAAASR